MDQRSVFPNVVEGHASAEPARFNEDFWTIGEMSRQFEVSLRTLRFYEDRGLISPLRHGVTRFYGPECRARFERILRAKKLGFTLSRIHKMLRNGGDRGIPESLAPAEIAAQISLLERQKRDLDQAIMDLRAAHAEFAAEPQSMARAG